MTPAIEPDELVTEIEVPIWPSGHGFAFKEFARRHGDFAIASAAVLIDMAHGKISRASIVIGGLDVAPARIPEAEEKLVGRTPIEIDVLDAAFPCGSIDAGSDAQASSEYRKQLARVMAARAIEQALERAQPKGI